MKNKYRVKQVNNDWLFLIPLFGIIMLFFEAIFGPTYKIQKRYLWIFWKDIKTVRNYKDAVYECNKLNSIHNHKYSYVYLENAKHNIIIVKYCSECGEILSVKKGDRYNYRSSRKSIQAFNEVAKKNINKILEEYPL